ncbi:MAG TPA: hypothetical protein VGS03_06465 [Candidatus Polarisedimenticolia bacterium]|jgi:hypothetical protein|nr:hypothetical protein [Candidatus Polarisedimenticolia bacterium]
MEIRIDEPVFIGFKASRALRQLLESLGDLEKAYVSRDDGAFLRSVQVGEDLYVGKFVPEAMTTDRVDDIRRNVLSILRKLGPAVPLPTSMRIFSVRSVDAAPPAAGRESLLMPEHSPTPRLLG